MKLNDNEKKKQNSNNNNKNYVPSGSFKGLKTGLLYMHQEEQPANYEIENDYRT